MSHKYTIPEFKNSKMANNNTRERVANLFNFNNNKNNKNIKNIKNNTNRTKNIVNNVSEKAKDLVEGFKFSDFVLIILIILVLFLIGIVLYYLLEECYQKKPFGQYLTDMTLDPCLSKYEPSTYKERELKDEEEVFHISNQDFTYEQAKCKCKAYGGRLATKDEIIKAYNKGADWCTYGWSEGQTAFYPTQKCTWDKLQQGDPKHRFDCGLPGVNGGFFANPKLKFGVNCYGVRPKGEIVKEKAPVCEGKEFCAMNINYNASHKLDTDRVIPFNQNRWSQWD